MVFSFTTNENAQNKNTEKDDKEIKPMSNEIREEKKIDSNHRLCL